MEIRHKIVRFHTRGLLRYISIRSIRSSRHWPPALCYIMSISRLMSWIDYRLATQNMHPPGDFWRPLFLESLSIGELKSGCLQKSPVGWSGEGAFFKRASKIQYIARTIQITICSKFVWYMTIHLYWYCLKISSWYTSLYCLSPGGAFFFKMAAKFYKMSYCNTRYLFPSNFVWKWSVTCMIFIKRLIKQ